MELPRVLDDLIACLRFFSRLPLPARPSQQNPHGRPDLSRLARMAPIAGAVIAEGVETEAQMVFLRENNCDEMQGYCFSRPLSAPDIEALLRAHAQA